MESQRGMALSQYSIAKTITYDVNLRLVLNAHVCCEDLAIDIAVLGRWSIHLSLTESNGCSLVQVVVAELW